MGPRRCGLEAVDPVLARRHPLLGWHSLCHQSFFQLFSSTQPSPCCWSTAFRLRLHAKAWTPAIVCDSNIIVAQTTAAVASILPHLKTQSEYTSLAAGLRASILRTRKSVVMSCWRRRCGNSEGCVKVDHPAQFALRDGVISDGDPPGDHELWRQPKRERWLSGRKRRFAKSVNRETGSAGSNPVRSAFLKSSPGGTRSSSVSGLFFPATNSDPSRRRRGCSSVGRATDF
jgi:hypothetical protein